MSKDKANPYSGAITREDPGRVRYDEKRYGVGGNGKGDSPRPVDPRKYRPNFDNIDWSK